MMRRYITFLYLQLLPVFKKQYFISRLFKASSVTEQALVLDP